MALNVKIDAKNVANKLGKLQKSLKTKIEGTALYHEVKRKVETSHDVKKVVTLVEKRKKQLAQMAKELPRDVREVRTYIKTQRKELHRLGNGILARLKAAQQVKKTGNSAAKKSSKKKSSKKAR